MAEARSRCLAVALPQVTLERMNAHHGDQQPIFRSWTANPDAHVAVDGDFVQSEWVRVSRRGPLRIAFLVALTLIFSWVALGSLLAVFTAGNAFTRVVVGACAGLIMAGAAWILMRAWVVGTFLNDHGVRIRRAASTDTVAWQDVADIRESPYRMRIAGIRMPFAGRRMVVDVAAEPGWSAQPWGTADAGVVSPASGAPRALMRSCPTEIGSLSADYLGRAEAYAIAASRLSRWRDEVRRTGPRG